MRRLLLILALSAAAAAQTTPNLGLNVPVPGTLNWGNAINQNFFILDSDLATVINPPVTTLSPGQCFQTAPPAYCAGATDLGVAINNAIAALPVGTISGPNFTNLNYHVGIIYLPACNGSIITPIAACNIGTATVHVGPGVSFIGLGGKFGTIITCTVATDCILIDHSAPVNTNQYSHTVLPNSRWENITIQGNGAAGQNIIHTEDMQGVAFASVFVDGASATGTACWYFQNISFWTERNEWTDASSGYNCNIGWRFSAPGPHPSFGYNRMLNVKANTAGAQTAISMEGASFVYNGIYNFTVNKGGTGSVVWNIQDTVQFYKSDLNFNGEENGSGGFFLQMTASTALAYYGNIYFQPGSTPNNIAIGASITHLLDESTFSVPPNLSNQAIAIGGAVGTGVGTIDVKNGYYLNGTQFFPSTIVSCGATTTCAATQATGFSVYGKVTLAAGTATITALPFTTTTWLCTTSDQTTVGNGSRMVEATATTGTVSGTGTDVIAYVCVGS